MATQPVRLNLNLTYQGKEVGTVGTQDRPEWVAADICAVLGLKNVSQALSTLTDREKGITNRDTLGGRQSVITVTEAGLYRLIFKSRKAEAEVFQEWVCNEVLPCIRKHGTYPAPADVEMVQVPAAEYERMIGRVEHLERALDRVTALLEQQPVMMLAPARPQYTVLSRLKHLGYGKLTKKARQRISVTARGEIERVSEDPPIQAGGQGGGGPCYYSGVHVRILDDAIDETLKWLKEQSREEEKRQPSLEFEVRIRRTDAA